jgi:hypothetical protein
MISSGEVPISIGPVGQKGLTQMAKTVPASSDSRRLGHRKNLVVAGSHTATDGSLNNGCLNESHRVERCRIDTKPWADSVTSGEVPTRKGWLVKRSRQLNLLVIGICRREPQSTACTHTQNNDQDTSRRKYHFCY